MTDIRLATPDSTTRLGMDIARVLQVLDERLVVTLTGELGAGKTALARAIIQGLGYDGPVVSPSYTLIESYDTLMNWPGGQVHHLDLYRLGDPEELAFLGIRELMANRSIMLVEWPDHGAGFMPPPDWSITLAYLDTGRQATIISRTATGRAWLDKLSCGR